MAEKYIAPSFELKGFNCPHCNMYAHQLWKSAQYFQTDGRGHVSYPKVESVALNFCTQCGAFSIWVKEKMVYPTATNAPFPSDSMPTDVKTDFLEARDVLNKSPRSAAALLRLAIQKLTLYLGEKGENLNSDIGSLVKKGLPAKIQKALDSVRVVGNNAVHPGLLDLKDDIETANKLFELVNFIVEFEIATPAKIEEIYKDKVPEKQKDQIKERDNK